LLAIIFILEIAAGALAYAYKGKVSYTILVPVKSVQVTAVRFLVVECHMFQSGDFEKRYLRDHTFPVEMVFKVQV